MPRRRATCEGPATALLPPRAHSDSIEGEPAAAVAGRRIEENTENQKSTGGGERTFIFHENENEKEGGVLSVRERTLDFG